MTRSERRHITRMKIRRNRLRFNFRKYQDYIKDYRIRYGDDFVKYLIHYESEGPKRSLTQSGYRPYRDKLYEQEGREKRNQQLQKDFENQLKERQYNVCTSAH